MRCSPARFLLVAALLSVAFIGANALRLRTRQLQVAPIEPPAVDALGAAQRLGGAVRLRTISPEPPAPQDPATFLALHAYLDQCFPRVRAALQRETVHGNSLLYTWTGTDAGAQPIIVMAHQDVVPVADGSAGQWQEPPFSGAISGGYIWGRGAWDDKGNLMAVLEAVESLLTRGFRPQRTIYLAFGHDEENGGHDGAAAIAHLLAQRHVHAQFVLDEGTLIAEGIMPGLERPLALIGVAEKGAATVALTAVAVPGHSSMPGSRSAIGALAAALERVEARPMPSAIGAVPGELFDTLAPEMPLGPRLALSNRWLFGPLLIRQLQRTPATDAMLRTTVAITAIRGGEKQNVLPDRAEAWLNVRLLPGDTIAGVVAHLRQAIDDPQILITVLPGATEASPVASRSAPGYRLISRTLRELFPDIVVAPGLMIGATDSRHLLPLAQDVYRFSPVRAQAADLARFHGTNERISIGNYTELIQFYETLIRHAAGTGQLSRVALQ